MVQTQQQRMHAGVTVEHTQQHCSYLNFHIDQPASWPPSQLATHLAHWGCGLPACRL
jgi:hypothetical protein